MPSFRGIEIYVVASSCVKKLPEFPHPDASSVRLTRIASHPTQSGNGGPIDSSPSVSPSCPASDPTRQKKVNPCISVYIPSSPGDQFYLEYLVNHSSPPSRFVFFKMFIDGRHTVSWGIDTNNCSSGTVTRSLFKPGHRSENKNGNTATGIETRYFHFVHGLNHTRVAEDGGLIEVQVFRCRGRSCIAVELDRYSHRHQERCGVVSLGGGLVENPQDAAFYEYCLEDSRDSPYATFSFHYRSMEYLEQLNTIPHCESRLRLVATSPGGTPVPGPRLGLAHAASYPPTCQFAFGVESLDRRLFDGQIQNASVAISERPETLRPDEYHLKSPPNVSVAPVTNVTREGMKRAQRTAVAAEIMQRPLPELPKIHSRQGSRESAKSTCPSLTPSLRQYVESEEFESEEIRLSTAQPLLIPSESMQALELSELSTHGQEDNSFSDYAASPTSSATSQSPALPPPEGYVPTTGSALERQLDQFDSAIAQSSPKNEVELPSSKSEEILNDDRYFASAAGTLRLSEAEWLGRSPSPLRRRDTLTKRLWSPRPGKRPGRSSMVELPTRDGLGKDGADCTAEGPVGNWI
ncbi:hypothetical protein GGR54DRAFT_645042 [Hypoxylon sp. NC1633]|nr:hypothetical protein GGR54DRAFT_645042 [Hypoxylon sp. NC1633]